MKVPSASASAMIASAGPCNGGGPLAGAAEVGSAIENLTLTDAQPPMWVTPLVLATPR